MTNSRAVLKFFADTYPVIKKCLPLAIGIDKQLAAAHPEIDAKKIKSTLFHYTHTATYFNNVVRLKKRYGLDGVVTAEIADEQLTYAKEQLKAINARRNAAKLAEEERKASEVVTQKLGDLVAKFGRK